MARSKISIAKYPSHLTIRARTIMLILLFASGFLAVQRFTIAPLNAFFCLLPFSLFIHNTYKKNNATSAACLLIALICSIDNGGEVYAETPTVIRYAIYLSALYLMLINSRMIIIWKSLLIGILLTSGILLGTIAFIGNDITAFDFNAFRRDIQVLLVLMFFLFRTKLKNIDLYLVYAGCQGYLLGEVLNALIFYEPKYGYMSFDTLKVIVFFPFIYSLITQKRIILQLLLLTATLIVIFMYGSRMLIISAVFLFLTAMIISLIKSNNRISYIAITAIATSIMIFDTQSLLNSEFIAPYRALHALIFTIDTITSSQASDLFLLAEQLDPVRFGEHSLFFNRSWIEILLGSGFGTGIYDLKGTLGFVRYDQYAFTAVELSTSKYFNFHDFWIDFGLRFGLIAIIYFTYKLTISNMLKGKLWLGVLFGLLILNTTFATSGILLTALIVRFFPVSHAT